MSSKTLVRCLAVLVCLGILVAAVPNAASAAKASGKLTMHQILKQPALIILSILPAYVSADSIGTKAPGQAPARVRPTTDIPVPRPGTGD